ncbi:AAA family ATPase [Ruminococcus bicirculans]|uniref:Nuclease SbcCD subunit C n=1 Tax=Ruminococcus bicirculans (ex Wegman et al. 2014) TaxID=1160721 RepID=A0AAW6EAC8_9FIRM|nr:AAA family ATPase [Ruminococcus bicirculans (ex Wegman et al. 2014)]MDB8745457.1 AAA family ATPase [Ruminococcus bicirculans (ex Wegman et al. 2014)]MDB8748417.1 AAA family ATPase [Ruminococcus bicirculans (ex Wegman et al. 2014)]MDB8753791.1 AAA family ATPase [Ruminococcus bicirculans (ex Wegman et al. 2014)]
MTESIMSLKISGRCFPSSTKLKCFTKNESRISIIYGKNGSGKSTISKSLCNVESDLSCSLLDQNDKPLSIPQNHIFVFNEDYINDKIAVQNDGLSAVILFGEQVEIDKQIEEANEKLEDYQRFIDDQESIKNGLENDKNSNSYKYKINNLKDKLKSSDNWVEREFSISGRRHNISTNILDRIFNKPVISKSREEAFNHFQELKSIIGTGSQEKISDTMKPLMVENDFFQNITQLLAEKIEKPVLNDRDKRIIEIYSQKGSRYITEVKSVFEKEDQNICPYCFRPINSEEKSIILSEIEKILSEEAKNHQRELAKYDKSIAEMMTKLDKIINIADDFIDIYANEYETVESQYRIVNSLLSQYGQSVEDKINSLYTPISFSDNNIIQEIKKLNDAISRLEEKRNIYNQQIEEIDKSKKRASDWNREIAYWEFSEDYIEYQEAYNNYQECCRKMTDYITEFNKLKEEIENLNNKKKNVVIAKDMINKALSYVFFSNNRLQLDVGAESGKYYLISNGIKVTPDKVSTGERNIIALCYFFTQMLDNHNSTDNFTDEYFIVIDDPISSFDRENQVGVITYLKCQLSKIFYGNKNSKILLLSHDLSTVYDLEKAGEEIGEQFNLKNKFVENYELKQRQIDNTKHIDMHRHEYSLLMKEIYKYAKGENALLSDLTIGNSMRRLLEAHGTFLYKKGIDALTTNEDILDLCKNHKNYFRNYMYRLVLNGESHLEERVLSLKDTNFFENYTSDQLKDTAQKIICYLYLINPLHVKEHLSDKGNSLGNYINVIERWIEDIPAD